MKRADDPQVPITADFHSRDDAEMQICRAVAALGRLAGIDVDQGEGPDDIDAVLIEATYESNFDDPHFIGGPGCLNDVENVDGVDLLTARATPITRGLLGYICKRANDHTIAAAEAQVALIDAAFAWLRKTVCSP